MCIAILNDNLVRISIKFRPLVPNGGGNVEINGPAVNGIRTAVDEDRQAGNSDIIRFVEKRPTLTPLAAMSSARSGLGAAILDGQLVAVGTLLRSLWYNTTFVVVSSLAGIVQILLVKSTNNACAKCNFETVG